MLADNRGLTIDKLDDDGVKVGDRPLGIGEPERRLFLGAAVSQLRPAINPNFTSPLPEDLDRHTACIERAEVVLLTAQSERDAAADCLSTAQIAVYNARVIAAEQAFSIARTPPPFVANYCYAADGTAKVFRTVEWWHHLWPSNHTTSRTTSAICTTR